MKLVGAIAVLALSATATGSARAEDEARRVIEEVVVTAQKTEQSSQDVPISLTTIGGDFIKEIGATNMQDLAAYVPNLKFSSDTDPALAQINVRGFGTNPLNAAFESSVGFAQDDLFFGRPSYVADAIFDLERVEVLRGPQGTLFGKNTVAGVFNTVTAGPTEEFSGDVRLSITDPEETRIEAGAGAMLTDWFGARVALLHFDREGELQNTTLDRKDDQFEQMAGRVKVRLVPTDDLEIDLVGMASEIESTYWPLQLFMLDDDTRTYLERFDPKVEDDPFNHRLSFDTRGFLDKRSETLSLKAEWFLGKRLALEDLTATLVIGDTFLGLESEVDLDASPADIGRLPVVSDYDQQSLELRLSGRTDDGPFGLGEGLELVVGTYLFRSEFTQVAQIVAGDDFGSYLTTDDVVQLGSGQNGLSTGIVFIPGIGDVADLVGSGVIGDDRYRLDYELDVEAIAWFGQVTWHLHERWAVTPGLRFNREEKRAVAIGQGECATKGVGLPCIIETALSANDYEARGLRRRETDLSPKVSLQHFWGDDITFFATWARGFKSGGFNGSSFQGDDLVFEEERASTYELGVKGMLFDRSLRVNATVFRTDFENLQVLAFNGAFFDVTNAASAISEGLELDFLWLTPLDALELSGSLGLLDARYDSYPNAPAPVSDGINTTQDLSGRPVALAPEQTASITPTLTLPVFGLGLRSSVDFLYQGDQFTDTDLDPVAFVPGHWLLSARVSIGRPDQLWALTVGGSNLTDEGVANQILDTVFFPETYNVTQRAGRKIFLALTARW